MQRLIGLDPLEHHRFEAPVVSWGIFDGVHRGHEKLLGELVAWARATHGHSVLLTFDPHPRVVLEHRSVPFITSLDHRLLLLDRLGIDAVIVIPFTREFAGTPAEVFFEEQLVQRLGVRGILLGEGAMFGRGRLGSPAALRERAAALGIEVRTSEPLLFEGAPVSSTAIRREITDGNLERAGAMLGRRVAVLGTVVHGAGRGRTIGFPTANLDLHHEARPPGGVYATRARTGAATWLSLTNIGSAPTFVPPGTLPPPERVEVHLLDFAGGDLYGKDLEIEFLSKIREERAFPSVEQLVRQIEDDRRTCIRRHSGS